MWEKVGVVFVAPLVAGVVAALATNYFSARFSFARFRREQWWAEKRDVYHSIVRKLSDIAFNASAEMSSIETGGEIVPPRAPQRDKALSWSLQEIASSGAYIVSPETVKAIENVLNTMASSDVESGGNFHKMLELDYAAAQEALATVRTQAHQDLGVS